MAKAFLSHSSKQKKSYVEIVAKQLGVNNCVYDSFTFEEGMMNYEEIERGMGMSDLFVIFLSESALESPWVQKEIFDSYELLKNGGLKRIFPIIIDEKITYKDSRIPNWIREEYNLQYVSRPSVATRRIKQRLIEISWDIHPILKEKHTLFVGRNNIIRQFEERFDSFENPSPVAFFACGIISIGRRSIIYNALRKSNIIRNSYLFPTILMEIDESIEDFIKKVYDLGFSDDIDLNNLLYRSVEDKISICKKLFQDLDKAKEILLVIDNGAIIPPSGELVSWFDKIIRIFESENRLYTAIASKYRLLKKNLSKKTYIFSIDVPELDGRERVGLLKRYSDLQNVELDEESINLIVPNLYGFPEQVFFTIDTIKEDGLINLKKNPNIIVEYNTERVAKILDKYEPDPKAYDFLNLLSQFDFISLEYLFSITGSDTYYRYLINQFIISAICEFIGATKEYVRINDTIRDYVSRSRRPLPKMFIESIKKNTELFIKDYALEEHDVAEYFFSIKDAITKGLEVPREYLIPSHFLKSMNDLYNKGKKYNLVVELADRVLLNSSFMDKNIERQIRYMLCVSLIRTGENRFLTEIAKVDGPDYHYLFGFYFRLSGKSEKAIESLEKYLKLRPYSVKGIRELVQALIDTDDYERALYNAKLNYESDKLNPYNIQPYIRCLLKVKPLDYKHKIEDLINVLSKIKSDIGREMYLSSKADFYSLFDNDQEKALATINKAIYEFPNNPYPYVTKLEICEKFRNVVEMSQTLIAFNLKNPKANTYRNTYVTFEAKLLALQGQKKSALEMVDNKLVGRLPNHTITKIKQIIQQY